MGVPGTVSTSLSVVATTDSAGVPDELPPAHAAPTVTPSTRNHTQRTFMTTQ